MNALLLLAVLRRLPLLSSPAFLAKTIFEKTGSNTKDELENNNKTSTRASVSIFIFLTSPLHFLFRISYI